MKVLLSPFPRFQEYSTATTFSVRTKHLKIRRKRSLIDLSNSEAMLLKFEVVCRTTERAYVVMQKLRAGITVDPINFRARTKIPSLLKCLVYLSIVNEKEIIVGSK